MPGAVKGGKLPGADRNKSTSSCSESHEDQNNFGQAIAERVAQAVLTDDENVTTSTD